MTPSLCLSQPKPRLNLILIRDNRLIYLEAVTPLSSLPPIIPASMVKLLAPPEISSPLSHLHNSPGGLGRPFFESLVPQEVSLAVRVWDDRKSAWAKEEVQDRSLELDRQATEQLEQLGLPGSLQAVAQPVGLPPSLLAKAQEVRAGGGAAKLRTMAHDVRRVALVDQQILSEARAVMSQEQASDEQHRAQFGTDRWTRVPSQTANKHLKERADGLEQTLDAARASDQLVRTKFAEFESRIQLLGEDEVSPSSLPPSLSSFTDSVLTNRPPCLAQSHPYPLPPSPRHNRTR